MVLRLSQPPAEYLPPQHLRPSQQRQIESAHTLRPIGHADFQRELVTDFGFQAYPGGLHLVKTLSTFNAYSLELFPNAHGFNQYILSKYHMIHL